MQLCRRIATGRCSTPRGAQVCHNAVFPMTSRRRFLAAGALAPAAAMGASTAQPSSPAQDALTLNGEWQFRLDATPAWRAVTVPHTWQTEPAHADYMGVAWYRREFEAPTHWRDRAVRLEFEAVFHSAAVTINGKPAGSHIGKGYTAFTIDASPHLRYGARNTVEVRVDNAFSEDMLPRGKSSDWTHDGGIYRPVTLHVTPRAFIEHLAIDADPALISLTAELRNTAATAFSGSVTFQIVDDATGLTVYTSPALPVQLAANSRKPLAHSAKLANPKLWHFDHPHLYRLHATLSNGHTAADTFGIRKIETRDGGFYLNGERVRLMGVERMAGSHPVYGMAEPASWIDHDHADMRNLNCIYTRVHWQQDRRILDWCDRHGMLIQTEVPTWGGGTFKGMTGVPSDVIMNNGLEQLGEMIRRDRNHPCIFSWGICNEIAGQNPPAYKFAQRMYKEAKRLDPKRLVTYASNSLQKTPEKDAAGLMDYIMWNEYYESWYKGTPADMARNLEEIHRAFPGKAIVISEYGYCACAPGRDEVDARRGEILLAHDAIFRSQDYVAGLIFFCYNDYRTHIGDKGLGPLKQRVHGVVDLYGNRKPSYESLRNESSPVEALQASGGPAALNVMLATRSAVPCYTLRGYTVRAVLFGDGDIPLEQQLSPLADLAPGARVTATLRFTTKTVTRIEVDVLRPDGCSTRTAIWKP